MYTYIIEGELVKICLARELPVLGEGDGARDDARDVLRDAIVHLAAGPPSGST